MARPPERASSSFFGGPSILIDPRSGEAKPHPQFTEWLEFIEDPQERRYQALQWIRKNDRGYGIRTRTQDPRFANARLSQYFPSLY